MTEFKLPELGENIEMGHVIKILTTVGDIVKKDQPLLELETDKAAVEIPSAFDGIIREILISENSDIKVGQTIMRMETSDDIKESKEPDIEELPKNKEITKTSEVSKNHTPENFSIGDVAAAPSVRLFAREIGVDILQIQGTGPTRRISLEDVKAYSRKINSTAETRVFQQPNALTTKSEIRPLPDFSKWGNIQQVTMNTIRQKTAQHLSFCWKTIPHVTQFNKADITDLEKLRKRHSTDTQKLTVTPFLLKVLASALKTFPQFNASFDAANNKIIYKKYVNIGIAVETEKGLLVPVIKDVDKRSIIELSVELSELAERARNQKITLEELSGGCMTISNLGGIGGTLFTPIVNWPEVAILGVSRAKFEPHYADKLCAPRLMLPLSLSYDHRVIDGADGARFSQWIVDAIEQPFLIELGEITNGTI